MVSNRSLIISFIGIDGSGKSTLAKSLLYWMESKDLVCKYVWGGAHDPFFIRPLLSLLVRKKHNPFNDYNGYSKSIDNLAKIGILAKVYHSFTAIQYLCEMTIKVRFPSIVGKNIILDRYFLDALVSLAISLNYSENDMRRELTLFSHIFPQPDITFFIDVPESIAYERKDDIYSLKYLEKRRASYLQIYTNFGEMFKINRLDGEKTIKELNGEIQELISGYIKT